MHKIFFYNKFLISLYMFRALFVHHQEVKIVLYSIWYHHTYRWPSRAQIQSGASSWLIAKIILRYRISKTSKHWVSKG